MGVGRPAAVKILLKRDAWGCDKSKIIEEEISLMRDIELPTAYHVATLPVHYPTSPSRTSTVIVMEPVTCFITGAQLLLSLLERIIQPPGAHHSKRPLLGDRGSPLFHWP